MIQLLQLTGAVIGGFIIYRALSYAGGDPEQVQYPEFANAYFGDNQMVIGQGMHSYNRIEPIDAMHVDGNLAFAKINNGLFMVNENDLNVGKPKPTRWVTSFS